MGSKIKKWLIGLSISAFLLYGLIYHTYVILFFIFIIVGSGYAAITWGKKIKDIFDDLK
jgi:hypothetical protein